MTQDEIIDKDEVLKMAKQTQMPFYWRTGEITYLDKLVAFAKLVAVAAASKEREACAKVCEDISPKTEPVEYGDIRWGWKYKCPYAAAIRARGEA
jgi:hypothetical protein